MPVGHVYFFFGEVFFKKTIFDWVVGFLLLLSCMSCLYILEIKPLSVASFANIFSHSVGCLFILFMVSFAVQKLISLMESHLFIFAFVAFVFGAGLKKLSPRSLSRNLPLCFLLGVLLFQDLCSSL